MKKSIVFRIQFLLRLEEFGDSFFGFLCCRNFEQSLQQLVFDLEFASSMKHRSSELQHAGQKSKSVFFQLSQKIKIRTSLKHMCLNKQTLGKCEIWLFLRNICMARYKPKITTRSLLSRCCNWLFPRVVVPYVHWICCYKLRTPLKDRQSNKQNRELVTNILAKSSI